MNEIILYLAISSSAFYNKMDAIMSSGKIDGCKYAVTSRRRSPDHNNRVGGAQDSLHIHGKAIDIVSNTHKCKMMLRNRALTFGFSTIWYKSHLHVDARQHQKCLYYEKNAISIAMTGKGKAIMSSEIRKVITFLMIIIFLILLE
jgi:hypothetical protein